MANKAGISTAEAGKLLGVSTETVRRWVDSEVLIGWRTNPRKSNSARRVDPEDVARMKAEMNAVFEPDRKAA